MLAPAAQFDSHHSAALLSACSSSVGLEPAVQGLRRASFAWQRRAVGWLCAVLCSRAHATCGLAPHSAGQGSTLYGS